MEGLAVWTWVEACRGLVTGALVYFASAGVRCPPCDCRCEPRLTCPGAVASEVVWNGLPASSAVVLALISACAGASLVVLALRCGACLPGPAVTEPVYAGGAERLTLEDISLHQARDIRARRLAAR